MNAGDTTLVLLYKDNPDMKEKLLIPTEKRRSILRTISLKVNLQKSSVIIFGRNDK